MSHIDTPQDKAPVGPRDYRARSTAVCYTFAERRTLGRRPIAPPKTQKCPNP